MALVDCKECGQKVSTDAASCPGCGTDRNYKKKTSKLTWVIGGAIVFAVFSTIFKTAEKPTVTPVVQKTIEDVAADSKREVTLTKVALVLKAIKKNLKDPQSVDWITIAADDDAKVICVEYRAKNSFGALTIEQMAFANNKFAQEPGFWNKYCGGKKGLHDMSRAKYVFYD